MEKEIQLLPNEEGTAMIMEIKFNSQFRHIGINYNIEQGKLFFQNISDNDFEKVKSFIESLRSHLN